jgi:hypothetical protein
LASTEAVGAGAAEIEFDDVVVLVAGGVYGAGWATLMFEMLSVNRAAVPAYVQWTWVIPHVNISGTCWKKKAGEGLAVEEVLAGGGATVAAAGVVMMGEMDESGREGEEGQGKPLQNKKDAKQK